MVVLKTQRTLSERRYSTLGDMLKSFGVPLRETNLERAGYCLYWVYVRGALVGQASVSR
jgi:hypothetical protein